MPRVTQPPPLERNFHIFFQLLRGMSPQKLEARFLSSIDDYPPLTSSGCTDIPGVNDAEAFSRSVDAMTILGLSDEERETALDVTAACLHICGVPFEKDAASVGKEYGGGMAKVARDLPPVC